MDHHALVGCYGCVAVLLVAASIATAGAPGAQSLSDYLSAPLLQGLIDTSQTVHVGGDWTWTGPLAIDGGAHVILDLSGAFTVDPGALLAVADGTLTLEGEIGQTIALAEIAFGPLDQMPQLGSLADDLQGQVGRLYQVTTIPEPASVLLLVTAVMIAGRATRRRTGS